MPRRLLALLRLVCSALAAVLFLALAWAGPAGAVTVFSQIKGYQVTLYYGDQAALRDFSRRVAPNAVTASLNQILLPGQKNPGQKMALFLDSLLSRVQQILDMPMPGMKLSIRLLNSLDEVDQEFKKLREGRVSRYHNAKPPAFYHRRSNTIFIQGQRVSIGMLAHEMGHAVLNKYFNIPPPLKVQEMLCIYIDKQVSTGR